MTVRRLVLDVLIPHDPSLLSFSQQISTATSVEAATASLIERDTEVHNVKLTLEGTDLEYDNIDAAISDLGGTIHSVDQVSCGEYIVQEQRTLQDR